MKLKFCVDCKYCNSDSFNCMFYKSISLVTGLPKIDVISCAQERDNKKGCGKDAINFEDKKEIKQ